MWKCGTFILLTLNILLLIAFYIINNGYSKKESLLTEKVNKLFYENISLQDNIILSKQGYCQLDHEMLLYTKDRDSIHLSEIKRKEYTLVLRYSTQCCSTCVEDILRKMRKFEEQYPDIDILLFTTYRVQIEKKDFQRICRFFPKVYNVFSLGIPLDEEVVPYLFVLDRGMRVIDTFIPDKDLPKLTNRYFERITTTLSRNKAYNYKYYKKEI